jgi:hypothetical protein
VQYRQATACNSAVGSLGSYCTASRSLRLAQWLHLPSVAGDDRLRTLANHAGPCCSLSHNSRSPAPGPPLNPVAAGRPQREGLWPDTDAGKAFPRQALQEREQPASQTTNERRGNLLPAHMLMLVLPSLSRSSRGTFIFIPPASTALLDVHYFRYHDAIVSIHPIRHPHPPAWVSRASSSLLGKGGCMAESRCLVWLAVRTRPASTSP